MITILLALIGATALLSRMTVNVSSFEHITRVMDFLTGVLVVILAIVGVLRWLV